MAKGGVKRHRPALRETREHDRRGRDTPFLLAGDQRLDRLLGGAHPGWILASHAAIVADVIPGTHHVAAVDRHGPHRRVGKHEPHARTRGQAELGHHVHEVVTVGAESVHPDDAGPGRGGGLDLDRLELIGHR